MTVSVERKPSKRTPIGDIPQDQLPVMWRFRADWFEFVPDDEFEKWERAMRERVGVDPSVLRAPRPGCVTISGTEWGWGDCDTVC